MRSRSTSKWFIACLPLLAAAVGICFIGWAHIVDNFQGRWVADTAPSTGQTMVWTNSNQTWAPGTPASTAGVSTVSGGTAANTNAATGDVLINVVLGTNSNSAAAGNDARLPTADQKAALAGHSGTAPSVSNKYVDFADPTVTNARTPTVHASTHQSGQPDVIALDTLGAPTDNTGLNASISAHGLLLKGDNNANHFLRGDCSWQTPPAGGSGNVTLTPGANMTVNGGTTPVYGTQFTLASTGGGVTGLTQYAMPVAGTSSTLTDSKWTRDPTYDAEYTLAGASPSLTLSETSDAGTSQYALSNYNATCLAYCLLNDMSLNGDLQLKLYQLSTGSPALRLITGSTSGSYNPPIEFFTGAVSSNWTNTNKRRLALDGSGNVTVTLQGATNTLVVANSSAVREVTMDASGNTTQTGNAVSNNIPAPDGNAGHYIDGTGHLSTPSGGGGVSAIYAGSGISVNSNTGNVTVTNTGVTLSQTPTTYTGITMTVTVDQAVAAGDACRISAATGNAVIASADVYAHAGATLLATATANASTSTTMLAMGTLTTNNVTPTVGGILYLSAIGTTTNSTTISAPIATGNVAQALGTGTGAHSVLWNPSQVMVEHQ